ncbi:MAG: PilZ domain-containing protein [Acidobacteria bacterium]|nr:PilZ domain-containing protein [Acidobacteriota bacterium]
MAKEHQDEDRRQHERVRVSRPIKLEATLRGRFIDIMRLEMTGMTIDMSGGGFCANVDQSISPGVRCRVELADEEGGDPRSLWGRVRRTTSGKNGYVVALEFDEPLEAAELLGAAGSAVIEVAEAGDDEEQAAEATTASEPAAKKPQTKRKTKRTSTDKTG